MKNRRIIVLLAFLMLFQTFATGMAFATDELNAPLIEVEDEIHNDGDGPADDSNGLEGPVDSDDNAGPDDEGTSGDDDSDQGNANDNESTPTENPENEGEGGTSHDENLDDPDQADGNNEIENPDGDEDANEDATDDNDSSETDEESDGNEQLEADGESDDTGLDEEGTEPTEENLVAAQAVIDLINYIDLETEVNGEYVIAVRAMFDALTPEQQALVTNVDILLLAETMVEMSLDADGFLLDFGVMSDTDPIDPPIEYGYRCDITDTVCLSTGYQFGEIVLGQERTVNISIDNDSKDYMYNVGIQLVLADGLKYVNADLDPSSIEEDEESGEQIVYWQDIKNLQKNEDFSFPVKVKSLEDYRLNLDENGDPILDEEGEPVKKPVDFGTGLPMTANVYYSDDSRTIVKPSDETPPLFAAPMTWTIVPFTIIPSDSHTVVKGAGPDQTGDNEWGEFISTFNIINNSRYETRFSYVTSQVDGSVQIYGLSSNGETGTNGYEDDYENNNRNFGWTDVRVGKGGSETLSFKGAFLNQKMAVPEEPETNGNNQGVAIKDGFRAIGQLSYASKAYESGQEVVDAYISGHEDVGAGDFDYNMAVAKDIIIHKKVSPISEVGYADTLTYNLTITTNEYYDVGHDMHPVIVTDMIGDGQTFGGYGHATLKVGDGSTESIPTPAADPVRNDGKSTFTWDLGVLKPKSVVTLEYTTTVDETWTGNVEDHITGDYIYAGDRLINKSEVDGYTEVSGSVHDESHTAANINTPTIVEKITRLNKGTAITKDEIKATVGDTVEFTINYHAGSIDAKQNKVEIIDYLPLGTVLVGYDGDLKAAGPVPLEGDELYPMEFTLGGNKKTTYPEYYPASNMLVWDIGLVDENTEIVTKIEVLVLNSTEHVTKDKGDQNLVILSFENSTGIVKSHRDSVKLDYIEPELEVTRQVKNSEDDTWSSNPIEVNGTETVWVKLTIDNTGSTPAYNVKLHEIFSDEFTDTNIELKNVENIDIGTEDSPNVVENYIYDEDTETFIINPGISLTAEQPFEIIYTSKVKEKIGAGQRISQSSRISFTSQQGTIDNEESQGRRYTNLDGDNSKDIMYVPKATIVYELIQYGAGDVVRKANQSDQVRVGDWVVYRVTVDVPDKDVTYDPTLTVTIPANQKLLKVITNYDENNASYKLDDVVDNENYQYNEPSGENDGELKFSTPYLHEDAGHDYEFYIKTQVNSIASVSVTQSSFASFDWSVVKGLAEPSFTIDSDPVNMTVSIPQLSGAWWHQDNLYDNDSPVALQQGQTIDLTYKITNNGLNSAYAFKPSITVQDGFKIVKIGEVGLTEGITAHTFDQVLELESTEVISYKVTVMMDNVPGSGAKYNVTGNIGTYYSSAYASVTSDHPQPFVPEPDIAILGVPMVEIENEIKSTTNDSTTWIRPGDIITYELTTTVKAGTRAFDLIIEDMIEHGDRFALVPDSGKVSGVQGDIHLNLDDIDVNYSVNNRDGKISVDIGHSPVASNEDVTYTIEFQLLALNDGSLPDEGAFNELSESFTTTAIAKWRVDQESSSEQRNTDPEEPAAHESIEVRQPNLTLTSNAGESGFHFADDGPIDIIYTLTNSSETTAYVREFSVTIPSGFNVTDISDGGTGAGMEITWEWSDSEQLEIKKNVPQTISFKLQKTDQIGAAQGDLSLTAQLDHYYSTPANYVDVESSIPTSFTSKKYNLPILKNDLIIAGATLDAKLNTSSYSEGGTGVNAVVRPGDIVVYDVNIKLPGTSPAYDVHLLAPVVTGQEVIAVENYDGKLVELDNGYYPIGNIVEDKTVKVVAKVTTSADPIPDAVNFEPKITYFPIENPDDIEREEAAADPLQNDIVEPNVTISASATEERLDAYGDSSTITIKVPNNGHSSAYDATITVEIEHENKFNFDIEEFVYGDIGDPTDVAGEDTGKLTLTWEIAEIEVNQDGEQLLAFTVTTNGFVGDVLDIVATVVEFHSLPGDINNIFDGNTFEAILSENSINQIKDYDGLYASLKYGLNKDDQQVVLGGNHTLSKSFDDEEPMAVRAGQTAELNYLLKNSGGGKDKLNIFVEGPSGIEGIENYLASPPEDDIFVELLVEGELVLIGKLDQDGSELEWICPSSTPTLGECLDSLYTIELYPDSAEGLNEVSIQLNVIVAEEVNYREIPDLTFIIHANSTLGDKIEKSVEDVVTITGIPLDGWSGEVAKSDWEEPPVYRHGIPLVLQAVTSNHVQSVYAEIEGKDIEILKQLKLELMNDNKEDEADYYIETGEKRWAFTGDADLLYGLDSDTYEVTFTSYTSEDGSGTADDTDVTHLTDTTDRGYNNPFILTAPELDITIMTDDNYNDDNLHKSTDQRTVTVTVTNNGYSEAHNVLVEIKPDNHVRFNYGAISGIDDTPISWNAEEGYEFTFEGIAVGSENAVSFSFVVDAKATTAVKSQTTLIANIIEYYSLEDGNGKRYDSEIDDVTIQVLGNHTLEEDKKSSAISGATVTIAHTLTNTGAGEDTFVLDISESVYDATLYMVIDDERTPIGAFVWNEDTDQREWDLDSLHEVHQYTDADDNQYPAFILEAGETEASRVNLELDIYVPSDAEKGDVTPHILEAYSVINELTKEVEDEITVIAPELAMNFEATSSTTLTKSGQTTDFKITVGNDDGDHIAYSTEVIITVPKGLYIVDAQDKGLVGPTDGKYTWEIETIGIGQSAELAFEIGALTDTPVGDDYVIVAELTEYFSEDKIKRYPGLPKQLLTMELAGSHTLEADDEQSVTAGTTAEFESHTLTNTGAGQDSYVLELTSTTNYPVTLYIEDVAVGTGQGDDSSVWTWTPIAGQEKWFDEDSKPVITLEAGEPIDISLAVHVPETARYGFDYKYTIESIGLLSGEDDAVTNTLKITGTELDGWSSAVDKADWTAPEVYRHGMPLVLQAVTSNHVKSVFATIEGTAIAPLKLELVNNEENGEDHYIKIGEKQWKLATGADLLNDLERGIYSVTFKSYMGEDNLGLVDDTDETHLTDENDRGYNNPFILEVSDLTLTLVAIDADEQPIANPELVTPSDQATFKLTIENDGSSSAYDVELKLNLGEGLMLDEAVTSTEVDENVRESADRTSFTWTIDEIAQTNDTRTLIFTVTAPNTTPAASVISVNAKIVSYSSLEDGGKDYGEVNTPSVPVIVAGNHTLEANDEQSVTAGTTAEFESHTLTNTGAGQDSYVLELTSTTNYPVTLHIDGVAVGDGQGDDSSVWTWRPNVGHEKWFDEDNKPVITLEAGEPIEISLAVHVPEAARYGHDYEYTIHAIGQLSGISGTADTTVTNTLQITGTELDGWSGEFTHADIEDDRWNKPTYGQVDSVFIGAVSAVDVQSVSAEVTVDVVLEDGEPEKHTKKVMLELINDGLEDRDHYIEAGEKYWTGTIRLPVGTQASDYSLVFIALDGDDTELERDEVGGPKAGNNLIAVDTQLTIRGTITEVELDEEDESTTHLPIESALVELYDPVTGELINSMETDEHGQYSFTEVEVARYKLVVSKDGYSNSTQHFYALPKTGENEVVVDAQLSPYQITLYANPTSILGDGESTTELTAIITDKDGKPIEGIVAHFSSPTNRGTFPEGTTETTDERGIAKVTFKSDKIGGTASVSFPVFMEVNDPVNELYASTQIVITFEPGAVVGVVSEMVDDGTGNGTKVRKLIANALVEVSNEEIGFYGSYVTGESGEYAIGVPVGGLEYHVSITKPFIIGDTEQSYTFRHKAEVGAMNAAVYETFPAVNSGSGMIMLQTPSDGPITTFDDDLYDAMEAFVVTRGGDPHDDVARIPVQVYEDGTFDVHRLAEGDYDLYITLKADMLDENNNPVTRTVVIAKSVLEISDEGEMNLTTELVDPYGDVRRINKDGPLIEGAKVTLYYADDDTEVHLPELLGFDPFDNLSPTQTTDHRGHYAWMVYPETDYYVVATAPGYRDYKSPNIRVDWDIVRHDIFMTPITPPGGGFFPPVIDEEEQEETEEGMIQAPIDLAISISADQRSYMEHSDIVLTIDYLNRSADNASQVRIILDLPQDAEVVDIGDGELSESGDQVIWYIEELSGGHIETMDIVLRAGEITTSQQELISVATITSEDELINLEDDKSTLKLMLFSNDYDVFTHVRYIQGYPDKEFKLNRNITRAEIATIFARILNLRPYVTHDQMYTDVAVGQWYADAIEAVTKRGLFNGYNDGTFRPDEPITRAELTSVIFRFMELDERPPVVIKFEDLHGHWAANIIEDVYRNRVAEGYVDGTFRPDQHLVRSEAVTMINRLLYRGPLHGVEPSYPDVPTDHWAFGDVEESTRSHDATRNEDTSEQLVRDIEATLDF